MVKFFPKFHLFVFLFSVPLAAQGAAANCQSRLVENLRTLKTTRNGELRAQAGACLVSQHLGQLEVARAVLKILRDPQEDILLREDLIVALGESSMRRSSRLMGSLSPQMGEQDKAAVERTIARSSANNLLEFTQAVKSINEVTPVTTLEGEYFRTLSELALDDNNHVLLRATSVQALEKLTKRIVESGVYEEKTVRLTRETLQVIATREDSSSYYSGAGLAYGRLAAAGLPGFMRTDPTASPRMLSSVKGTPSPVPETAK